MYVRAQLYRYRFTTPAELRRERVWWHRALEGEYVEPCITGSGATATD